MHAKFNIRFDNLECAQCSKTTGAVKTNRIMPNSGVESSWVSRSDL